MSDYIDIFALMFFCRSVIMTRCIFVALPIFITKSVSACLEFCGYLYVCLGAIYIYTKPDCWFVFWFDCMYVRGRYVVCYIDVCSVFLYGCLSVYCPLC